jgi:hypothetical protein
MNTHYLTPMWKLTYGSMFLHILLHAFTALNCYVKYILALLLFVDEDVNSVFRTEVHKWGNFLHIPYFTDYKTHFFLQKIASKIQVRLILEINTKMSSV